MWLHFKALPLSWEHRDVLWRAAWSSVWLSWVTRPESVGTVVQLMEPTSCQWHLLWLESHSFLLQENTRPNAKKNTILGSIHSFSYHSFFLMFSFLTFHQKLLFQMFYFLSSNDPQNLEHKYSFTTGPFSATPPTREVALPHLAPDRCVGFFPHEKWGQVSSVLSVPFIFEVMLTACVRSASGSVYLPCTDWKTSHKLC